MYIRFQFAKVVIFFDNTNRRAEKSIIFGVLAHSEDSRSG